MRGYGHFVLAGVAALLLAAAPGQATWVGINVDIHQDVLSPLPNDFHLIALICSASGTPPLVVQTVNGRPGGIQFPYVVVDVQPAGQPDPCWYWLDVNWFFPPGAGYIPYCQVIHLGVLLDVVGENVLIDAFGYWTRDGIPLGHLNPGLRNKGFVPIIGFDVPETGAPRMRIVNGQPTWLPPPPLPILPPPEIPVILKQIDMFAFPPGFPPPFEELWTGGQQQMWPWTFVVDANGNRIYDDNPLDFWPESFFDIFLEVPMPPIPPGTLRTVAPVVVEPGGFLVSRQRMSYIGNNNNMELTRWVWEVHGAQLAEACCFTDGSCQDLVPAVCMAQGGTPQGQGSSCSVVLCPIIAPPACCFADGSCIPLTQFQCLDMGGSWHGFVGCDPNPCPQPPVGACCVGQNCWMTTQFECATLGGQWLGSDVDCFPNPCAPPADYWIRVQNGIVIEQGGTGYEHMWFLYPNNWWNQWWPNEFALDRHKLVVLTFEIDFPPTGIPPVVAFNFAREDWPSQTQPPLPPDDPFVIRIAVDPPVVQPGTYTSTMLLPFCPRWVSVDVQGMTFTIQGNILHECQAPLLGACCVGWDCSLRTQAECAALHGRYLGDGSTCGPPNPCEIRDIVKCEPQPPAHPAHYWYDVTPGDFGRCDFHVRVYDTDPANYTNVLRPGATWLFAVHQLPSGEWWASWWDPGCQNAIFQRFRFGFDNPHESTWDGWTTTIAGNNDPYDWQIDNWTNHAGEPDGYGYRVHVPSDQLPLGACCLPGGICLYITQPECLALGGHPWLRHTPCDPNPCPPPNDNCPAQIPVGDVLGLPFDTSNATLDGPNHCQMTKNIWFCYTAPCTGWARIDTCGSAFDTKLAVYHDCYCNPPLSMMMCCDDNGCGLQSVCYIPVTAGHGFLIEVGGAPQSLGGPGVLNIQCFPTAACCFGPGNVACDMRTQAECVDLLGGVWHPGADCRDLNGNGVADVCEPPASPEACCLPDGGCVMVPPPECLAQGGRPRGAGTKCLGDMNGDGTDDICDLKWLQPPDLRTVGLDVNATFPYVLADDWLCEQTGVITEFTIWASWFQDLLPADPMNAHFWLAIHLDIPDPDGPGPAFSMPGPVVWARPFPPGSFLAMPYQPAVEGWLTPPGEYIFPGDTLCWLYRFRVPQWEAFVQGRDPVGAGTVYWLEVQAQVPGGPQPAMFGWKTTWKHWNDDAVWTMGPAPSMGPWQELRYPPLHPLFPASIDLAFGLHELRVCPGDVNSNGVVDFDDIDPFVEALGYPGGVGWPHEHWLWLNADCDGDGDVDFDDIDPFVARIGTVCPP